MNPKQIQRLNRQSTVNLINFFHEDLLRIHRGEGFSKVMPTKNLRNKMTKYGVIERVKSNKGGYRVGLTSLAKEELGLD